MEQEFVICDRPLGFVIVASTLLSSIDENHHFRGVRGMSFNC
jgi:hypothetical protein